MKAFFPIVNLSFPPIGRAPITRVSRAVASAVPVPPRVPQPRTPARVFRRCRHRIHRPLAAALLVCSGAGVLAPVPAVLAQDASLVAQGPAADAAREGSVNINTASAAELAERLNGVGASKAEAIVRYREQFGPFESIDELVEVGGIGAATIERNRALLRLR